MAMKPEIVLTSNSLRLYWKLDQAKSCKVNSYQKLVLKKYKKMQNLECEIKWMFGSSLYIFLDSILSQIKQ